MKLLAPLFEGRIDIVGDVHGDIDALQRLLVHLGYDRDGVHPDQRRLVFVGDLVDRGPDSPAVLELVMALVNSGRAQCLLGNHELNLLRPEVKKDHRWYKTPNPEASAPGPKQATADLRERADAFLGSLPLALEREDLRVVHACWNDQAIAEVRRAEHDDVSALALYERARQRIEARWQSPDREALLDAERDEHELDKPELTPPVMPTVARMQAELQMGNPVAVLTSGEEAPAGEPFFASGQWRMVRRVPWWQTYRDHTPVIIGHYWRRYTEIPPEYEVTDSGDLFQDIPAHQWFGAKTNVYCVDFSIASRHAEKTSHLPHLFSLAALRVPEWKVWHDNDERWPLKEPGHR